MNAKSRWAHFQILVAVSVSMRQADQTTPRVERKVFSGPLQDATGRDRSPPDPANTFPGSSHILPHLAHLPKPFQNLADSTLALSFRQDRISIMLTPTVSAHRRCSRPTFDRAAGRAPSSGIVQIMQLSLCSSFESSNMSSGNDGPVSPCSMPSTLISSSMSGQRTPSPSPRISQCCRCSRVASAKRHDQTKGTLIVRPSIKCAMISSSVTSIVVTRGSTNFAAVLMPCLQYSLPSASVSLT